MAVGFVLDLLFTTLTALSHTIPPEPQPNPLNDRMDFSIGIASRYIEMQYLDQEIKDANLHGIDLEFKVFPFGAEHFFFGIGGQYLTNGDEKAVKYKNFSMPIGLEFEKHGYNIALEFYSIDNLFEKKLKGDSIGIYYYYKLFDDLSLHIGFSGVSSNEEGKSNQTDNYEYSGSSLNTYLKYKF